MKILKLGLGGFWSFSDKMVLSFINDDFQCLEENSTSFNRNLIIISQLWKTYFIYSY